MSLINEEDVMFMITKDSVQAEAVERMGRELDEYELTIVKDCLWEGLMFDISTVYGVAFKIESPRLSEPTSTVSLRTFNHGNRVS